MKTTALICSAFVAWAGLASAQQFTWGYPFPIDDETGSTVEHVAADKVYRLASVYDINIFNYRITADALSADKLERSGTKELGLSRSNLARHHSMYHTDGSAYTFFITETDRTTTANNLYWQEVNIETGDKSENRLVTSIEGKSNNNNGRFVTARSPSGSYYAVLKEAAFVKKELEKIEIVLLDAKMTILGTLAYEYEWEADRTPKHSLHVDDAGNVYIAKRTDLPKLKPFNTVFVWKRNGTSLIAHSLKQPDDFQIAQMEPHFRKGELYLTGLLTSDGATTFGMKIGHTGVYGQGLLCSKFSSAGDLEYSVRNDFEKQSTASLAIVEVLSDDKSLWVVMERMSEERKTNPMTDPNTAKSYTYSYSSKGFMFSHIDPPTGKASWHQQLNTAEKPTTNDNGAYLSVLPMVHGSNLLLLYNETQEKQDGRGKYARRVPVLTEISPTGTNVRTTYIANAGIGTSREELYELDTSHILPLGNSKFLVRARESRTVKYGYLEL